MKHLSILSLLTLNFSLFAFNSSAAVGLPQKWEVDLAAQPPQVFQLQRPRGETYELEAVLNRHGKPFEPAITNACIYWQTNGMENLYWSAPASVSNNALRATWLPSMDPGATTVRGYIGDPGHIYAAAFQFRFIASPGPTPNELPLPQKVIDFAKVTVLNPPWSGGGGGGCVDTNAVRDIVREQLATNGIRAVDGAARTLPKYLHERSFDSSYPDEAQEYYRSRGNGKADGGCSAVRDGDFLYRNFDYPFDDRAEFVVRMSSGVQPPTTNRQSPTHRFASVGVAQVGTNLTEQFVVSGKPSRWYKCLPGATVDGINENGVACNINVVDGDPQTSGWHNDTGDLHPLAAVRWVLDNATNAHWAALYIASHIAFPQGWTQNFHYMIADKDETWIVENGVAGDTYDWSMPIITNYQCVDDHGQYDPHVYEGPGIERFTLLREGQSITNAWFTNAYRRETTPPWDSDLADVIDYKDDIYDAWAAHDKEYFRGKTNNGIPWWQSVHTSVYDITNRVLRVAVQETDDWYVFQVPSSGAKIDLTHIEAQVAALQSGKRDKTDYEVYENGYTAWNIQPPTWNGEALSLRYYQPVSEPNAYWYLFAGETPGFAAPVGTADSTNITIDNWAGAGDIGTLRCTRTPTVVHTSDRLATTNGVNAAIEAKDLIPRTEADNTYLTVSSGSGTYLRWSGSGLVFYGPLFLLAGFDNILLGDYTTSLPMWLSHGTWNTGDDPFAKVSQLAAKRDLDDNTCHKTEFGEWTFSGGASGIDGVELVYDQEHGYWEFLVNGFLDARTYELPRDVLEIRERDIDTFGSVFFTTKPTATRSAVCTDGKKFVTSDVVDGKVSSAVSTNNPAFVSAVRAISPSSIRTYDNVRQCWWVLEMVNGVPTWTVED